MYRLYNQVAIITGGGSGLGKAGCLRFAEEGAIVIVADYDLGKAIDVADIITHNGMKAEAVAVNVADSASVGAMVDYVVRNYGKVDILVNNAGITRDKSLLKLTEENFDAVIDVNLKGVFLCTQAVAPHMIEQGYGKIVNTSSIVRDGNFGQTNYSASKAGVVGMTKTWAKELGPKGIRVNAVAPGFILTPMTKAMPSEILEAQRQSIPLKRLGDPEDVANAYLFLASHESDFVNGTVLECDGGQPI
jgi:3-oxoacyl-[acyl-carrier protein] reductase